MANYKLNITTIKILETIRLLNEEDYYPNIHGVLKIVNGKIDSETKEFVTLITFSTLTSMKPRKIASHIHQLIRYNYLSYKHNPKDDKMYLYLTFKGESNLEDYKKHHRVNFKKTNLKEKEKTIAYIK